METNTSRNAGAFGMRAPVVNASGMKPWSFTRPAVLAGFPVITGPDARRIAGELCPSHRDAQAFGDAVVDGNVPPSKGSNRPAPPG